MELKPGYKQTEVGVIPEDWDCVSIQRAASNATNAIVGGPFGSDLTSSDYVYSGVPVVRGTNMGSRMIEGPFVFVSTEKAATLTANLARPRDVIFTQRGTLGQVSLVPDVPFESYLISQSQMKVSLDTHRHSPQYVYHYFSSAPGQKQIRDSAIQTGVPHTNLGICKKYLFPAPSFTEQLRIGAVLDDLDSLIEAIDSLLGKKKQIKQAAMQELLTGKRRLPGFKGEWEVKRLEDIATIDPENLDSNTQPHYQFNYISLEDVDQGSLLNWSEQEFSSSPSRARRRLRLNDVLVSTVRPNLKSHLLFSQDNGEWVCSTGFATLRCNGDLADPSYVYFHLFGDFINKQIKALLTGSNYPAINSRDVRSLEIPVPALPEQKEITRILSSMEDELISLAQRLEKASSLKLGIMQQLLTGKIRLK